MVLAERTLQFQTGIGMNDVELAARFDCVADGDIVQIKITFWEPGDKGVDEIKR
jgi:hypothetical protein